MKEMAKEFNNWNFTLLSYESELSVARLQRFYELGFPTAEKLINKLEEYQFISPKNENDKRVVLDKLKYLFIVDKYVNGNLNKNYKDILRQVCRVYHFADITQSQFLDCVFRNKESILKDFNKEINNNKLWAYYKDSTWGYRYELDNNFTLSVYNSADEDLSLLGKSNERRFNMGTGKLYMISIITQSLLLKIMIEYWNKENEIKLPTPTIIINSEHIFKSDFAIIDNLKELHNIESYTLTRDKEIIKVNK